MPDLSGKEIVTPNGVRGVIMSEDLPEDGMITIKFANGNYNRIPYEFVPVQKDDCESES